MKYLRVWFALILIASALIPSAAGSVRSDEEHQNQTSSNERRRHDESRQPAPAVTIIVQPAPVKIIQPNAPVEKEKPAQKWYQRPTITDWGILGVTFVYALISVGLLDATRRQAQLAIEALQQTKIAADAAKKSADVGEKALYKTQSAIINFERIGLEGHEHDADAKAVIWFSNLGPTIAYMLQISLRARIGNVLPTEPEYSRAGTYGDVGVLLKVEKERREQCLVEWPDGCVSEEQRIALLKELDEGKRLFIVYGFIVYRDAFDRVFKQGFGAIRYRGEFAGLPTGTYKYTTQIT